MILESFEIEILKSARENYDIDSYEDISSWLETINKYGIEDDYFNDKELLLLPIKPDGINETAYLITNPDKTGHVISQHLFHLTETYGKDILVGLLNSKDSNHNISDLLFKVEEKLDAGTDPTTIIYIFELIVNQMFPTQITSKKYRI